MIKIFEEENDIISVSKEYIEQSIFLYLKNNIIDASFDEVKIEQNFHNKDNNYSVIFKMKSFKFKMNYQKLKWYMENIKFYLQKNFNINFVVTIGIQ